jgi:hypothetical protein
MDAERRRPILLAVVVVVLAVTIYRLYLSSPTSVAPVSASQRRGPPAPAAAGEVPGVKAPDVHLDTLSESRPKPAARERNLFRFKPKELPPAPPRRPTGPAETTPTATLPAPPPPAPVVPSLPFKFIGIVQQQTGKPTIAILSDSKGSVFHGLEGETIEGRYKILKIGAESIEMASLDGGGRQTIRLSGQ